MSDTAHVVYLPFGGLSAGIQLLNGGYACRVNRRYDRTGHLFQNRFSARQIESEGYLLEACRYVALNPVRAGLCDSAKRWPWNSYRACAGLELAEPFLAESALLSLFDSRPAAARRAYRAFVASGHGPVSDTVTGQDTVSDTVTGHRHGRVTPRGLRW